MKNMEKIYIPVEQVYGECVTGKTASERWYAEVSQYDFSNPHYISGTGHFTQLVWKSSKQIGCGAACNSYNKCFLTCNYIYLFYKFPK